MPVSSDGKFWDYVRKVASMLDLECDVSGSTYVLRSHTKTWRWEHKSFGDGVMAMYDAVSIYADAKGMPIPAFE